MLIGKALQAEREDRGRVVVAAQLCEVDKAEAPVAGDIARVDLDRAGVGRDRLSGGADVVVDAPDAVVRIG
jgi:hypothetical protein